MLLSALVSSVVLHTCLLVIAYTPEEDDTFETFLRFALDLKQKFEDLNSDKTGVRAGGRSRRQTGQEFPGFYALPLPYLPGDVRANLASMELLSSPDEDLVALANSLFSSSEDVLRPVVNYSPGTNQENPAFDPFDLYAPQQQG